MRAGDRISDYIVAHVLGEGGMGTVYLARHTVLDQQVAIKILDPEVARKPDIRERFILEANIQARLKHPHIVQVLTATSAVGDTPALIMEYVDGRSLSEVLEKRGVLPIDDAVKIMGQVLSAVGHAHKQGVIHRDLKPSNVMVTAVGDAKVTDFGIAKVLGSSKLTRSGTAMGSAHYMSPEQIRRPETADSRSDIYSLGCVFYEVLTGRPPFGDKEISGTESDYDVKTSHVTEAAPALGTVKSGIPAWLAKLVMSMLEKAPDHRPASCEAILKKLKAIDSGEKKQLVETAGNSDLEALDHNKTLDQYDHRSIAKISFLQKKADGLFNKGILSIAVLIILITSIYLLRDKTKSLMLQQVEPPKLEVSSPEPEPAPEPPKPAPEPKPPAPVVAPEPPKVKTADPDIALEQDKKRKLQKEKEKLAEEKQQREEREKKQLAEEQKRQKEEQALKDNKKLEEEQKRKQEAAEAEEQKRKQEAAAAEEKRKQEKAAEKRRKASRAEAVDTLLSQVGDGEAGTAEKKSGAPGSVCELYIGKTVKSNISFPDMPGNPIVTVSVRLTPRRMLEEVKVVSASEYPKFDSQVERGIRKSGQFPAECPEEFTYKHFLKPR